MGAAVLADPGPPGAPDGHRDGRVRRLAAQRPPGHGKSIRPALWIFDADMRRAHPQERAFHLGVGDHDTARNEVGGKQVRWALSGPLTRSGDGDVYVFDCHRDQRGTC